MASHGFCQKGESCTFAHSLAELQGLSATASQWDGMPGTAQVMGMAGMPQAMGMAGTQQHMGMAGMAGVPQPMAMSAIPQPPSDQDLLGAWAQNSVSHGLPQARRCSSLRTWGWRRRRSWAPPAAFRMALPLARCVPRPCSCLVTCRGGTYMAYQGTCDKGDACTFAHSASELQGGQMEAGGSAAPASHRVQSAEVLRGHGSLRTTSGPRSCAGCGSNILPTVRKGMPAPLRMAPWPQLGPRA